ncbi:MAG: VWA domain-containing protein [Vampirovibrionales bacterium]|nr:VWA domain-containing protein [Vampirovibrionales bacterium]
MGHAQTQRSVLIILDASSSMSVKTPRPRDVSNGTLGATETRMTAAKRAVLDLVRGFPPETPVGLRVYGNGLNPLNPCRASQLLVPIAWYNRAQISAALVGIQANGATPITHTLRQAVNQELSDISGPKSIILVSDGQETCDDDPCDVARLLARSGIDLKIDVIGFGVHDAATEQQLKCISAVTLGNYMKADTYGDLTRQLQNARAGLIEEHVEGRVLIPTAASSSNPYQPQSSLPASSESVSKSSGSKRSVPSASGAQPIPKLPDMEPLIPLAKSAKPAPLRQGKK